jgi:CheY-like chemotaxis protein
MTTTQTASRLNTAKVLLVDDNRNGLIVRKSLLEEAGFSVQTASNGEEALGLFTASQIDVVITDYRMPRMSGSELIVRIRQHNPEMRIILLSSVVEPLGLNEQNTRADVVLAKDAKEASRLIREVKRLVNQRTQKKPPASQRRVSVRIKRAN